MCRKLSFLSELWCMESEVGSVCRCWMFVSAVQPVIILSAVFWVVWSLLRFVSEMMGDQRVFPYSMTGRVMVL